MKYCDFIFLAKSQEVQNGQARSLLTGTFSVNIQWYLVVYLCVKFCYLTVSSQRWRKIL